jgi:hypothetical protein
MGLGEYGKDRTERFRVPTSSPSRISRASSEWPTSSNASVESWPPTSRRTSSPPLLLHISHFCFALDCNAVADTIVGVFRNILGEPLGRMCRVDKGADVRVLVNEA